MKAIFTYFSPSFFGVWGFSRIPYIEEQQHLQNLLYIQEPSIAPIRVFSNFQPRPNLGVDLLLCGNNNNKNHHPEGAVLRF